MISSGVKQLYASIGTLSLVYVTGHLYGALSLMLPALRQPGSGIQLTLEQESWIPSVIMLMVTPTHFVAGYLSDLYGRRLIMCVSMLPIVVSSFLMYSATSFIQLLAAAMIIGLGTAGVAVGQTYIAEAVSPKRRGAIMALNTALTALGLSVTLALGKFVHWRTLMLFNAVPGLCGLITSVTSPDSPMWYASKGRFDECRSAFVWFRGIENQEEMRQLMDKYKEIEANKSRKNNRSKLMHNMKIVCEKSFLKSTLICFAAIICVEASGKPVYIAYALDFMVSMTGDKENANYYALGAVLSDLVALSLAIFVLRLFKRRTVLFTTGFLALILLMAFCTLSYLRSKNMVNGAYSWAVLVSFLAYFVFINIGVLPVLLVVQREIYPVFHRGLGIMVSGILNGMLLFIIMKIFPYCLNAYGIHGTFLINGVMLLLALSYLYYYLPETGNKTLQDIECEIVNEKMPELKKQDFKLKMVYVPCHPNARESFSY